MIVETVGNLAAFMSVHEARGACRRLQIPEKLYEIIG